MNPESWKLSGIRIDRLVRWWNLLLWKNKKHALVVIMAASAISKGFV